MVKKIKRTGCITFSPKLTKKEAWEKVETHMKKLKKQTQGEKFKGTLKLNWKRGPPGFTYMMGTNLGWNFCWLPLRRRK